MSLTGQRGGNVVNLGEWSGYDPQGTSTIAGIAPGNKTIPPYMRNLLDVGEEARAYFSAQQGGAWHKNWPSTLGQTSGYFIPLDRAATPDEMTRLATAGKPYGMGDITSSAGGVTVTGFDPPPPKLTVGTRRQVESALNAARPQDAGLFEPMNVESNYLPPAWSTPGAGTATDHLLAAAHTNPSIYGFFNNNADIGRVAVGQAMRDKALEPVIGPQRDDIWNSRIVAGADPEYEGQGVFDRLAKYRDIVAKGGKLPASIAVGGVGVSLFPTAGFPAPLPQQPPGTSLNSTPWPADPRQYGYDY
jgi:hypothetical protein